MPLTPPTVDYFDYTDLAECLPENDRYIPDRDLRDFVMSQILSVRSRNALMRLGCKTLRDLEHISEGRFRSEKNLGSVSQQQIKELMKRFGLSFALKPH